MGRAFPRGCSERGLLKGSWDLETRVIIKVTIRILTDNPQLSYLQLYLLSPMNLQVGLSDPMSGGKSQTKASITTKEFR